MTRLSIILAAAAVAGAGLLAVAPQALAGGDLDYGYGRDDRSSRDDDRGYGDHHRGRHDGSCLSGVRAVGKGWPFPSVARKSAIKAWEREARYVHGDAFAYWENARHQDIECTYINGVSQRCEARANPCRM